MEYLDWFKTLFLGHESTRPTKEEPKCPVKRQCDMVNHIWLNRRKVSENEYEENHDFGLERIIRLLIAILLFLSIGLYVRCITYKYISRKKYAVSFAAGLYALCKMLLPFLLLLFEWTNCCVALLCGYMIIDTMVYLAKQLFISDNPIDNPISSERSLILLLINYIQIALSYAVVYYYYSHNYMGFFNKEMFDYKNQIHAPRILNKIQSIYFSFVTSATVGYGDIVPESSRAQGLVISQIICSFIFVVMFFSYFVSKVKGKNNS
jgi:hypothetical protein